MSVKWISVGIHDVVADGDGMVIAKVAVAGKRGHEIIIGGPVKLWVYEKYIGEFVSVEKAKTHAESWLKFGRPSK